MELASNAQGQDPSDVPGASTTIAGDLGLHPSRSSRYLDTIEELRGRLDRAGSATV